MASLQEGYVGYVVSYMQVLYNILAFHMLGIAICRQPVKERYHVQCHQSMVSSSSRSNLVDW
jgi:hypothetical protein